MIADKALQLLDGKEDTILLFSPPPGAVLEEAQSWNVLNYRTPTAVTSSILGADITMQFAGGHITGNSGCNDFTALHQRLGEQRRRHDHRLSTGKRGCTTPPGVAEQEQAFSDALLSAVGYEIVGTRLTLLDNQGRDAVQLEARPVSRHRPESCDART